MNEWRIIHADALSALKEMPDGIVQCVVTSPPYYGLRDYGTDPLVWPAVDYTPMPGLPEIHIPEWTGDLGQEATPEMYIAHLVLIFREVRRVLSDTGIVWLNIGDSFYNYRSGKGSALSTQTLAGHPRDEPTYVPRRANVFPGLKDKDLMLIPSRLALALQADGWYVRSDVILHKRNPMPESVKDRPTRSHEYLFLLAKEGRYFYDAQAIAEPLAHPEEGQRSTPARFGGADKHVEAKKQSRLHSGREYRGTPTGTRNRRDVWTISTAQFKKAHFATFSPVLPDICIKAGTSERGQCPHCGAPWERILEKKTEFHGGSGRAGRSAADVNASGKWADRQYGKNIKLGPVNLTQTTGWRSTCECSDNEPIPQTVLDPFSGAGTTGLVAVRLGRHYIGIELNEEYVEMSRKRIEDDSTTNEAR